MKKVEIKTEGLLTDHHHRQKQGIDLGKIHLLYCQLKV